MGSKSILVHVSVHCANATVRKRSSKINCYFTLLPENQLLFHCVYCLVHKYEYQISKSSQYEYTVTSYGK